MHAKLSRTKRVKRRNNNSSLRRIVRQQPQDSFAHFARGFVRERQCKQLVRRNTKLHQTCESLRNHARLSAARSSENQSGSLAMANSGGLLLSQHIQVVFKWIKHARNDTSAAQECRHAPQNSRQVWTAFAQSPPQFGPKSGPTVKFSNDNVSEPKSKRHKIVCLLPFADTTCSGTVSTGHLFGQRRKRITWAPAGAGAQPQPALKKRFRSRLKPHCWVQIQGRFARDCRFPNGS